MKKGFRSWWIEIIAVAVTAVGIFLVVSDYEIGPAIKATYNRLLGFLSAAGSRFPTNGSGQSFRFTMTDLLGLVLAILAIGFFVWRIRARINFDLLWKGNACPKCEGPIHRSHRSLGDRLLGIVAGQPLRRYTCTNPHCRWTGLRYGKPSSRRPVEELSTEN